MSSSEHVLAERYALVSHLARGGMADVYIGQDQLLNRKVAVKVLHGEFARSEAFVERFRREAQAAANLTHPNIVAIHDWGEDQGIYYMVMELVQGRNLRDVLRSEGTLLPRRVAEIGSEVAAALQTAHAAGLVHRDVKPANVLLTRDGSVKVTDFGIARAWDDPEQLTRTGSVIGTATYFSPEQAQGLSLDGRSDVYSLGVVMYELLTGQPPFSGESPVAVAYQHVQEPPTPPSQLNPNVPPGLEAIVLRALAKGPEARYESADELRLDLQRLLTGRVPSAAPQNDAPTVLMEGGAAAAAGVAAGRVTPDHTMQMGATPTQGGGQPPSGPPYDTGYPDQVGPDRQTVVIGVLAAVALLGLGILLLVRLLSGGGGGAVTIPDVRLQTEEAATATLESFGLLVEPQQVPDPEVPAGRVTGTDPPAETEVDEGSTVVLLVSIGEGIVEVPRFIDMTLEEARTEIARLGLTEGEITFEVSPVVEADVVLAQTPTPGESVPAGTPVDLIVSAGSSSLTVPDVVGRSESDAMFVLGENGFQLNQIRVERRPSADVLAGFVIETDPEAGAIVPLDGTVTVVVSEGPVPTVIPDVVGESLEDATTELEELGFVIEVGDPVELPFEDPLDGLVAEQDPSAGQTVEFGSTVTLQLGVAEGLVEVPDVLGDNETTARQKIEGVGLVFVKGDDVAVPFGDPDEGRAVDQDPNDGTEVEPGSEVTVNFGVGPPPSIVPDVIGENQANATALIEAEGLVFKKGANVNLPFGHPNDGKAVNQDPDATTAVAPGSEVTVRFGVADPGKEPPDVVGFDEADAVDAIEDEGFTYFRDPADGCVVDPANVGKIAMQDPEHTETVATGSEVQTWVGVMVITDPCPPPPPP